MLFIGPNDENLVTRALAAGADDYLLLPLRPAELVARVRAVLRRAPHWASSTSPEERVLHAGDVRLDPESHEVTLRAGPGAPTSAGVRTAQAPAGERRDRAPPCHTDEPPVGTFGSARQHEPGSACAATAIEARRRPGRPQAHRDRSGDRVPLPGRTLMPAGEFTPQQTGCHSSVHLPFNRAF